MALEPSPRPLHGGTALRSAPLGGCGDTPKPPCHPAAPTRTGGSNIAPHQGWENPSRENHAFLNLWGGGDYKGGDHKFNPSVPLAQRFCAHQTLRTPPTPPSTSCPYFTIDAKAVEAHHSHPSTPYLQMESGSLSVSRSGR